MSYLVTAMRQSPDVGFTAISRQTAEGARDLAKTFVAEGMLEVEVRDDLGNLRTLQDLDAEHRDPAIFETRVVKRLAAI